MGRRHARSDVMLRPQSGRSPTDRWRSVLLAVLLATLVATAGCSGLVGSDDGAATPTDSPAPTTSEEPMMTEEPATTEEPTEAARGVSGRMTVLVNNSELSESVDAESFRFSPSDLHKWNASEGTTLADALATLDVEASEGELTYDGVTYDDSENGTYVSYRVNGAPVDPTEHTLAQGDEVWVNVQTPETNRSPPGEYIEEEDQHTHGQLQVTVEGEEVDFGLEKYQHNDDHFHFHDGETEQWHGHSHDVTLEYAISAFADVNASDDSFTYEGSTYEADDPETTIRYEVNGESVTPSDYYIKDGDEISVVVETDA